MSENSTHRKYTLCNQSEQLISNKSYNIGRRIRLILSAFNIVQKLRVKVSSENIRLSHRLKLRNVPY